MKGVVSGIWCSSVAPLSCLDDHDEEDAHDMTGSRHYTNNALSARLVPAGDKNGKLSVVPCTLACDKRVM